jgi:transposase
MKKIDGRKISSETMEEIRIRAVERDHAGENPEIVIKALGFARACIYNWLARYRAGGWHGLKTGARSGRPSKLKGPQTDGYTNWSARETLGNSNSLLPCGQGLWSPEQLKTNFS